MLPGSLQDLLYKVPLRSIIGPTDFVPTAITFDSRKVIPGSVFIAIKGTAGDGHDFIETAIKNGASAIIFETAPSELPDNITWIQVADSAVSLAWLAGNFYGNPSSRLTVSGVTGTNGKTTVATLLFNLFRSLGYSCGLISTVQNRINDLVIPATHTTPDAITLNSLMAQMLAAGCTHCFMEVSSHSLVQHRVTGIAFDLAMFTNLTHDHLDYHGTFDAYIAAKKLLFDNLSANAKALVNIDDRRGRVMLQNCKAAHHTYSLTQPADFKARLLANTIHGLQLDLNGHEIWLQLVGKFNAYNLTAIYGAAILLGEEKNEVLRALTALKPAPGRFEKIITRDEITVVIDYAHTPDALDNVLSTITELRTGNEQVITVIGCGGNRDTTKRPLMAASACKYSNLAILTSDNPRDEDPMDIIAQMQKGVGPSQFRKAKVIADRKEAIGYAIQQSRPGDIVLIAGKGHETYQEIKGVKYPFDDKAVALEYLSL